MVSLVARFGPARMWGAEIKSWEDYFAPWRASAPRNDGARHQANSPLSPMFHVEHGKLNTRAGMLTILVRHVISPTFGLGIAHLRSNYLRKAFRVRPVAPLVTAVVRQAGDKARRSTEGRNHLYSTLVEERYIKGR